MKWFLSFSSPLKLQTNFFLELVQTQLPEVDIYNNIMPLLIGLANTDLDLFKHCEHAQNQTTIYIQNHYISSL